MNKLVTVLLLSFLTHANYSQSSFSATAGVGFYELVNVGLEWKYSKISSLNLFVGNNFSSNPKSWSTGGGFNQVFPNKKLGKFRLGYAISAIYWNYDDELYFFESISFQLMPSVSYLLNKKLSFRLEGGVNMTYTLTTDRKQNVTAGLPNRTNGNINFKCIYNLSKHEE